MDNFYNKDTDTVEFDLIGEFGEDWWNGDISKESVSEIFNNHKDSNIIINLSSLGGSVDTAFAVHGWVAKHKGHTTVRLLGRNASSSTVFSTAFDKVEMADSGLFLIHNVWSHASGNSEELRKVAEDMDKHNDVIVSMYKKQTGMSDKAIRDLMSEEKWITAKEAKDLGFIDKIFTPSKLQDKYNNQIINNKYLPKMEDNKEKGLLIKDEKSFLDKIKDAFTPEIKDISEESKSNFENQISDLSKEKGELEVKNSELEKKEKELNAKIAELEESKKDLEVKNSELREKITKEVAEPTKEENKEDSVIMDELTDDQKAWVAEAKKFTNK